MLLGCQRLVRGSKRKEKGEVRVSVSTLAVKWLSSGSFLRPLTWAAGYVALSPLAGLGSSRQPSPEQTNLELYATIAYPMRRVPTEHEIKVGRSLA